MIGRLSTLAAAWVVARRDIAAILLSRSFIFFLLGPLFPVLVGSMAGGIGQTVQESTGRQSLALAMPMADAEAISAAHKALAPRMGGGAPDLAVIRKLGPGETFDPGEALSDREFSYGAVLTGTLDRPVLTGTADTIEHWKGPVSIVLAQARGEGVRRYPEIALAATATSMVDKRRGQVLTAQAGQMLLFLLTMLLAGMVLSNLVEEKGNKIIEVLAAAIPMDAVFLGKLFAMLAVSFIGIAVWSGAGGVIALAMGNPLPGLAAPAVGWPLFGLLAVVYFAMAYLLMGALFLTIGAMAATVREIQSLSMPTTFVQLIFFFLASYSVAVPGTVWEAVAIAVPFSSPYAMLARAALDDALWPHLAALCWQALWVGSIIRIGAGLFRKLVLKSGPAGTKRKKRFWRRAET
jgi:ABC-2 type transport system permease protein